jgi:redox-sensing transcriptional repressor
MVAVRSSPKGIVGSPVRSRRLLSEEGPGFSRPLLERLALYYQIVTRAGEEGQDAISSGFLAGLIGIDATLVRKDMAAAGITGRPKVGYPISEVIARLDETLGLTDRNDAILIGCGDLGSAIARYPGFARYGLKLAAIFDIDAGKVGRNIGGHVVLPMEKCKSFIDIFRIEIAILAAPASVTQDLADWLVRKGIKAVWNFAPVHLRVPDEVALRNENLALGLAQLIHLYKCKRGQIPAVADPSAPAPIPAPTPESGP